MPSGAGPAAAAGFGTVPAKEDTASRAGAAALAALVLLTRADLSETAPATASGSTTTAAAVGHALRFGGRLLRMTFRQASHHVVQIEAGCLLPRREFP
jgi:hypothetical protein